MHVDRVEEIEGAVLSYLSSTGRISLRGAAEAVGIPHPTLLRLMDSHPGMGQRIRRAMEYARQSATDEVEESLYDRAMDRKNGSGVTAAIFLLKGHRPARYAERRQNNSVSISIENAQVTLARNAGAEADELESPQPPRLIEGESEPIE